MSNELRPLTSDDQYPLGLLMSHAFSGGQVVTPPAPDAPRSEMKGVWGVFEDGVLKAALTVQDYQIHWGLETDCCRWAVSRG